MQPNDARELRSETLAMEPTGEITRVDALTNDEFIERFVKQNLPVVVTKALSDWDLSTLWTPEYFRREFGRERVQLYNEYFDFKGLMSLTGYLDKYFDRPDFPTAPVPYVRWYSKLRDVPFPWSDAIFERIRDNWRTPDFVPLTDYMLPYAPAPKRCDPVDHLFPARGLFISGKGGRTRLHFDPWQSDSLLCAAFGTKEWVFYDPGQAAFLRRDNEVVDLDCPDPEKFPELHRARPRYKCHLHAGEAIYVPRGWFHAVRNMTDSISVTWNFVHASTAEPLRQWSQGTLSEVDLGVARLFVGENFRELLRPSPSAS